jgi:hypothetical protein
VKAIALAAALLLSGTAAATEGVTYAGRVTPEQLRAMDTTSKVSRAEADALLRTGKPACSRGTLTVGFADGAFVHEGRTLSAKALIDEVRRVPLRKRFSCLRVESPVYDREQFFQLADALTDKYSVSLFWPKH